MPEPPMMSAQATAVVPPASFGLRALAKFADLLVLGIFQLLLFVLWSVLDALGDDGGGTVALLLAAYFLLAVGYFTVMSAGGRQTWGYRLAGLCVMTVDGQALSAGRAFVRTFVDFVSLSLMGYVIGLLDYLPVALTRSKRAGHDLLAGTRVVCVAPPRTGALAVWVILSVAAPFVTVFGVIRPFLLQPFYMPSPGMLPTLRVGDRFLLDRLSYALHPIRYGDVIVFAAPERVMAGRPDFVKRVGGLPGDVVRAVRGRVMIDGHEYNHEAVRDGLGQAGFFGKAASSVSVDQAFHHVRFVTEGVFADGRLVPKARLGELLAGQPKAVATVSPGYVLRNGKRIEEPFVAEDPDYDLRFSQGHALRHRYDTDQQEDEYSIDERAVTEEEYEKAVASAEERVPPGQLLVFGDDRNDSRDSAYWGTLSRSDVQGLVTWKFFPGWHRVR